jgi:hypothetical protein
LRIEDWDCGLPIADCGLRIANGLSRTLPRRPDGADDHGDNLSGFIFEVAKGSNRDFLTRFHQ